MVKYFSVLKLVFTLYSVSASGCLTSEYSRLWFGLILVFCTICTQYGSPSAGEDIISTQYWYVVVGVNKIDVGLSWNKAVSLLLV